jgi:hypothetical protein
MIRAEFGVHGARRITSREFPDVKAAQAAIERAQRSNSTGDYWGRIVEIHGHPLTPSQGNALNLRVGQWVRVADGNPSPFTPATWTHEGRVLHVSPTGSSVVVALDGNNDRRRYYSSRMVEALNARRGVFA